MATLYRTYSSPNLKDVRSPDIYPSEIDYDEVFYVIGDRVQVDGYRTGSVAYFGETDFGSGDWVGVVLDHPTGNHSGKVHGRQYFQCSPSHGLFVRPHRVTRIHDLDHSVESSRVSTPLDGFRGACGRWSKSPASSCMDSYFYDEDYRTPTVASLERKLKTIESKSSHTSNSTRSSLARDTSRSSTPIGILKRRSPRPLSMESKTEELARRLRASIPSSPSRPSVFNFRPKRAQLNEFGLTEDSSFSLGGESDDHKNEEKNRVTFSRELRKGDRVLVRTDRGEMPAILRYIGETTFAIGEWAGVELDDPDGKNDGSVLGHRYFYCPQHYGLFVPISRVQKYIPRVSKVDFKTMRSTIKSPPPLRSSSSQSTHSETATTTPEKTPTSPHLDKQVTSFKRAYSSSSSANSPIESHHCRNLDLHPLRNNTSLLNQNLYYNSLSLAEPSNILTDREKTSSYEADIDYQLRKTIQQRSLQPKKVISLNIDPPRPRSVKYTFQSSKYDGNPVAYRTLEYDR